MNPRLTILRKGLILIAVPLLFQVAFITLLAKMRRDGAVVVDWTIHTKDVMVQAQTCRVQLLWAHGAIQGYIITHDPSFERTLEQTISAAPAEFDALKALVVDREDQTLAATKIRRKAVDFLAFMSEGQTMVREGRMNLEQAAARRRRGQDYLDSMDQDFEAFLAKEREFDVERQQKLEQSRASLVMILVGGIACSIITTVVLAVIFSRNISGRIISLTNNAHRLALGKELTPPIAGNDEIARLDHVFHEMAVTLDESAGRERLHAQLLERRNVELDAVNSQLREKAQENEMFVYSVSHDLRSPLVNLQGFSKELGMIGKDLSRLLEKDGVPVEIRHQAQVMIGNEMTESIGFIQTAVTRLSSIIDALLRLSRAGKVEYRRQRVAVTPIITRVVRALRQTIDDRKAVIEFGELPPTWGDPTAVEQVFANLIGNAVNYLDSSRPGKIEIVAIDLSSVTGPAEGIAPGSVVYAVRDNGLGISDSYKSKVFMAFQRLHGDVAKGEGVGLALVRRVVERHGGRIWFESQPGQGTTFFVALPTAEGRDGEVGPTEDDQMAPGPIEGRSTKETAWQPSR